MRLKQVALAIMLGASTASHADTINHANNPTEWVGTLFSGSEQYSNFYRMEEIFPTDKVSKSGKPVEWPVAEAIKLPETYSYEGRTFATKDFLSQTESSALLVIKDGKIRYENYWSTGGEDKHWLSMSVSKSVVSALYGIAVSEGSIESINDPASKYLPALKGSAYDGVKLKDILQMSSGAHWNEDYSDPNSEIMRLAHAMASGSSFVDFVASIKGELTPGTFNRYCSADTLVLGLVLEAATKKSLAQYAEEKLWEPLGATQDSYWIKDNVGHTMAFGGYNATARDYARLGELFRLKGSFQGKQIVPASWVKASITPDAPHLMPGKRANSDSTMGYGYQWWIPEGDQHDYSAIGVYNQFIYVSPDYNTVIVKLSAPRDYGNTGDESSWREHETIELFREIAKSID